MSVRRKISEEAGTASISAARKALDSPSPSTAFAALPRTTRATAVRYLLEELASLSPGNSVEVRVPPYGVTQCIAGPHHRRGTPPNVVETDAFTWCSIALGYSSWSSQTAKIFASGSRSDLERTLPIL